MIVLAILGIILINDLIWLKSNLSMPKMDSQMFI